MGTSIQPKGAISRSLGLGSQCRPPERPQPLKATALSYAALCGFSVLANYQIVTHGEDVIHVNASCGGHGTPLHAALFEGHLEVVTFTT